MYLDNEPPIAGGREIWGFPKKHGRPKLEVVHDPQTGTLEYAGASGRRGRHATRREPTSAVAVISACGTIVACVGSGKM